MKLKTILIIFGILLTLGVGVYFISRGTKKQEKKIKNLEKEIVTLKETQIPIRYKIIWQENDKIKVSVKFYDLDGKQFRKEHFEMDGNVVSFDFYVIKSGERYIAFPYKIFTDKIAPENGTLLFDYYDKNNFPMVFYSKNSSEKFNDGIKALFDKLKNNDLESIEDIFGNMLQNPPKFVENGITGKVYKIVVRTKGGIEIIEE